MDEEPVSIPSAARRAPVFARGSSFVAVRRAPVAARGLTIQIACAILPMTLGMIGFDREGVGASCKTRSLTSLNRAKPKVPKKYLLSTHLPTTRFRLLRKPA